MLPNVRHLGVLARALLGVDARVPHGCITLRPLTPAPYERLELTGIPLADGTLDVNLRHGELTVDTHDTHLDVIIERPWAAAPGPTRFRCDLIPVSQSQSWRVGLGMNGQVGGGKLPTGRQRTRTEVPRTHDRQVPDGPDPPRPVHSHTHRPDCRRRAPRRGRTPSAGVRRPRCRVRRHGLAADPAGSSAVAVALAGGRGRLGAVHVGSVAAWAIASTIGLPVGPAGPEPLGLAGVVTVALELSGVVALLVWARPDRGGRLRVGAASLSVGVVLALASVAVAPADVNELPSLSDGRGPPSAALQ